MGWLVGILVIILVAPFLGYGRYYEPRQLEVKEVDISNKLGMKLVHFSDLHYGVDLVIKP